MDRFKYNRCANIAMAFRTKLAIAATTLVFATGIFGCSKSGQDKPVAPVAPVSTVQPGLDVAKIAVPEILATMKDMLNDKKTYTNYPTYLKFNGLIKQLKDEMDAGINVTERIKDIGNMLMVAVKTDPGLEVAGRDAIIRDLMDILLKMADKGINIEDAAQALRAVRSSYVRWPRIGDQAQRLLDIIAGQTGM